MAGLGRKVFTPGEVLEASELQGYAVDQSIMVFDNSSARTAAIDTPSEGMHTYLKDINSFEYWDGAAWQLAGGAGVGFEASLLLGGM
jgi:hypothetical protein